MGLYQWIVIFVIIFAGEHFIPEDSSYNPNTDGKFVYPGRPYNWSGDKLYKNYTEGSNSKGASRHYTILFNVFVFMQIFNMINWRKINDEFNVFSGIHKNRSFIIIISIITIIQFIIVQFTQDVFEVCRSGLTWYQWFFVLQLDLLFFQLVHLQKFFQINFFHN